MISCTLKLKLRPSQERVLNRWLWHLTGVYNWAIKKIELDAENKIYHSKYDMDLMVSGHGTRIGVPSRLVIGAARTAHDAWQRCFRRLAKRPRLKGNRNRLNTLHYRENNLTIRDGKVRIPVMGWVRFHKQSVPRGSIKETRFIKRSSGWYAVLTIDAETLPIPAVADGSVGIDPGFYRLLTCSTGEVVEHPQELSRTAARLEQAQRGKNRHLTARLREREGNQRKDRNHKLSRRLVAENAAIYWSRDQHRAIARTFGRSVASAAHGQLRQFLAYKSRAGGRTFVEVSNRYSTVTCSACGARSGPTGYAGLKVRQWRCGCGAEHDRDVNAAVNTLLAGRGLRLEMAGNGQSGITT